MCSQNFDIVTLFCSIRAKFGMYYVDFADPSRTRIPKASSEYYASIARANGFVDNGTPCTN